MKLIILILASDNNEVYLECQKLWRSYMNINPNVKAFFIKGKPYINEDCILEGDTIFVKCEECLVPGCLIKTVKSIDFLLRHYDFDYVFRTNLSSVVDINKFYSLISNFNNSYLYAGFIGLTPNNISFVSGAGILINLSTCKYLIDNHEKLNYNIIDDVAIGILFKDKNMKPLTRFEAYEYKKNINFITAEKIRDYYHFRCKSSHDHDLTISLMKKIISLIYNK